MSKNSNLNKLIDYLLKLGYSKEDAGEIISAYTALIPVLASISKRIYLEGAK